MRLLIVLLAVPLLAAQDEPVQTAGANVASSAVAKIDHEISSAARESRRHAVEWPEYTLPPGKIEIGGIVGANVLNLVPQANPSVGGEVVVGLSHGFGLVGETSWNRLLGLNLPDGRVGAALYEAGGGLRWSPFRWNRLSPYVRAGASWVHVAVNASFGQREIGASTDRPGANLGFGARVYLSRRVGVVADFGAIQAGGGWLSRFSTGFFCQIR